MDKVHAIIALAVSETVSGCNANAGDKAYTIIALAVSEAACRCNANVDAKYALHCTPHVNDDGVALYCIEMYCWLIDICTVCLNPQATLQARTAAAERDKVRWPICSSAAAFSLCLCMSIASCRAWCERC